MKNVLQELESYISSCEKTGLVFVCKKIETEKGKNYVVSRVIEMLEKYPSFTIDNCLAQIESELSEIYG
jgi:hypothetical protein